MAERSRIVHLVDDDEAVRRSVSFMLRTSGYIVRTYALGTDLVRQVKLLEPGCILLDIRMPQMDGLDVQRALKAQNLLLPVIVITGHGDIAFAVKAMKLGAVDFIEKPFEKAVLIAALDEGFARLEQAGRHRAGADEARARLAILTPRERQVLGRLALGAANKVIAAELGISPRTVEIHRANLMAKLQIGSLSAALRLAYAAGLDDEDDRRRAACD